MCSTQTLVKIYNIEGLVLGSPGLVPLMLRLLNMINFVYFNFGVVYFQKVENEKIISQIVGISKICDQNGDGVSKNYKYSHICSMALKRF